MTVTTNLSLTEDLKKQDTSQIVLKLTALEMIDLHYPEKDWVRVYTDGSKADEANTTRAEVHCKLFSQYATAGLNKSNFAWRNRGYFPGSTTAHIQISSIWKSSHPNGLKSSYSSSFFQQSTKIKEDNIKQALKHLQAFKITVIPVGSLPCWTKSQQDSRQTSQKGYYTTYYRNTITNWHTEKTLESQNSYEVQQEADELATTKKWRDIHKIWAEYKGKPKKEALANFRLKTGHDCLAVHLRKNGIYESRECTICQMPRSTMARNICYIALYSIPTNRCLRTPSNSTGKPEWW